MPLKVARVISALPMFRSSLGAARILLIVMALPIAVQAQVGDRDFIDPLITEDANPSNELDLVPQWIGIRGGNTDQYRGDWETGAVRRVHL